MTFSTNLSAIPAIYNYADAVNVYNSIVPIRGTNERRIGYRRQKQFTVEKDHNNAIIFYLHTTPCIKITEKNTVELTTGGWTTKLTAKFIQAVLRNTFVQFHKNYVVVRANFKASKQGWFALASNKSTLFKIDAFGQFKYISGAEIMRKNQVNKEKLKKVRKKWSEIFKVAKTYSILSENEHVLQVQPLKTSDRISAFKSINYKTPPKKEYITDFILNFIKINGTYDYSYKYLYLNYSSFKNRLNNRLINNNPVVDVKKIKLGEYQ